MVSGDKSLLDGVNKEKRKTQQTNTRQDIIKWRYSQLNQFFVTNRSSWHLYQITFPGKESAMIRSNKAFSIVNATSNQRHFSC